MKNNKILWSLKEVNRNSWDLYWPQTKFSNLMQSWEYGEAKKHQGWKPFRFLLLDNFGVERGLLQVLAKELPLIGGVVRINRGPVLFHDLIDEPLNETEIYCILFAIKKYALKRRWWYISYAPELVNTDITTALLEDAGYKKNHKKIAWGSSKLPLIGSDIDFLFMNLKKKWRNLLRKGQKSGVNLIEVTDKDKIRELVSIYENFQKIKKFDGISSCLLYSMLDMSSNFFQIRVYLTLDSDNTQVSGFVFIAYTGDTATYLIGWSNEVGREQQANYLLIWKSIEDAKKARLSWFDLGGINANTPKGVAHFKNGVNAKPFQNVGEYYSFFSI
jgi:lipid II:glycine glycyltransferase (peptidoglycan interpeptide bridge formation enzyme)